MTARLWRRWYWWHLLPSGRSSAPSDRQGGVRRGARGSPVLLLPPSPSVLHSRRDIRLAGPRARRCAGAAVLSRRPRDRARGDRLGQLHRRHRAGGWNSARPPASPRRLVGPEASSSSWPRRSGSILYVGTRLIPVVAVGLHVGVDHRDLRPDRPHPDPPQLPEGMVGRITGTVGVHSEAGKLRPLVFAPALAVMVGVQPALAVSGLRLTAIAAAVWPARGARTPPAGRNDRRWHSHSCRTSRSARPRE